MVTSSGNSPRSTELVTKNEENLDKMMEARNDAFQIQPQEKLFLNRVTFYISSLA